MFQDFMLVVVIAGVAILLVGEGYTRVVAPLVRRYTAHQDELARVRIETDEQRRLRRDEALVESIRNKTRYR